MRTHQTRTRRPGAAIFRPAVCITLMVLLGGLAPARAEYITGFEDLDASPAGVILTGQDGYYIPPGTISTDFLAFTYMDNALGLPENPTGGEQFIGGTGLGDGSFARAQRDMDFSDGSVWYLAYDFAAVYLGTGESANNIGSFSLRNETAAVTHYIHLMSWVDPLNPTSYNAFYMPYDAGGAQFPQPGGSPGFMWEGLQLGHWYRAWTKIDLDANMIIEVGIMDLGTGGEEAYEPTDWYLEGGSAGGSAAPMSLRFFAGGGLFGNSMGFDNIEMYPEEPTPAVSASWGAVKTMFK
jgi:hypothetical protein